RIRKAKQEKFFFFASRTAKIRRIINKFQMFFEKYFYLFLFLCVTFHTSVFSISILPLSFSWKSGAKV
ncbi:hypothetical protein ABHZ35_11930, partial [Bacteroides uniformis]